MDATQEPIKAQVMDRVAIRDLFKRNKAEDIAKAKSKAELMGMATIMEAKVEGDPTKQEIVAAIVAVAKLPNPSLRGRSTREGPVSYVWHRCDQLVAAVPAEARPRRKDLLALLQKEGIAYYTARTQIQSWSKATNKGTRRLSTLSNDELPKELKAEAAAEA